MSDDTNLPFFPFGKQVAFNGKFGQRILFQCVNVGDSKKLSDLLNEAYKVKWRYCRILSRLKGARK